MTLNATHVTKIFSNRRVVGEQSNGHTAEVSGQDHIFIPTVAESKIQLSFTIVESHNGVAISIMCARKGGCEDLAKEKLANITQ